MTRAAREARARTERGARISRDVGALLAGLDPARRKVVAALRDVARRTVPDASESVVWGALSYHRPWIGGRVKGAVCMIGVAGGDVRLEFIHGVRIADPARLLRGQRVSKRHVAIGSVSEARRPEIAALIRRASRVELSDDGRRSGERRRA